MRIFISGGCKNGKSYCAQRLAKAQQSRPLYYVATMAPVDAEDHERIERHRRERDGWGFTMVEQPARIEGILDRCDPRGSFLLDSLTALLAGEMFPPDGGADPLAAARVTEGLTRVLDAVGDIVVVSDYVFSDAEAFEPATELFRKSLAEIGCAAAKRCDAVLEATYANVIAHKGGGQLRTTIHSLRENT